MCFVPGVDNGLNHGQITGNQIFFADRNIYGIGGRARGGDGTAQFPVKTTKSFQANVAGHGYGP